MSWFRRRSIAGPSPQTERVMIEILAERFHQVHIGWTPEHDDAHYIQDLQNMGLKLASMQGAHSFEEQRKSLIQGIAMLIATVESMDRRRVS